MLKKILKIIVKAWKVQGEIDKANKQIKPLEKEHDKLSEKYPHAESTADIRNIDKLLDTNEEEQRNICLRLGKKLLHKEGYLNRNR